MESKPVGRRAYYAALVTDQKRETSAQIKIFPLKITYRVAVLSRAEEERKKLFSALSGIPVASIGDVPCQLVSSLPCPYGPEQQVHLYETRFSDSPESTCKQLDFDLFLALESETSPLAGLARWFPASHLITLQRDREGGYRCAPSVCSRESAGKAVLSWLCTRLGMTVEREGGKENEGVQQGKKTKTRRVRSPFANLGVVKQLT